MDDQFSRTELMIGKENIEKINNSKVVVFGLGGVGSYVVEGLARAGIGNFILVDNDIISNSNINRQLIALHSTTGMSKVHACKNRILDINPNAKVEVLAEFFDRNSVNFLDSSITYIADCIDTISSKIELVLRANNLNIPIISCMGTGNKLNPEMLEVSDIYKTSVCPLAKVMRKELKARNIKKLKVVYSKEEPIKTDYEEEGKRIPGSISFVPSVAGLIMAGEIVKDIIFAN